MSPSATAANVGGLFFPQARSLQLAVDETLSPAMLQKVVYAGANERSFRQAHDSLKVLAEQDIPVRRIERITERVGTERVAQRNRQTAAWEAKPLVEKHPQPHPKCTDVAMLQFDGGRAQVLDRRVGVTHYEGMRTFHRIRVGHSKVGGKSGMPSV